jgi:hypothetical protein
MSVPRAQRCPKNAITVGTAFIEWPLKTAKRKKAIDQVDDPDLLPSPLGLQLNLIGL